MAKKILGFDVSYLKKEIKEPAKSKMSAVQLAHEGKELKSKETSEHKAAKMMQKALSKKR